jgi:GNAT superfamily N-acetyltransferase
MAPSDAEGLVAFHEALSSDSVILRFFGPHPHLSDKEVQRFTTVDGVDRVALVAEQDGCLVAVARYDRPPGSEEAEVAFVVADHLQGHGLGPILLRRLVVAGRAHGVSRFVAETLSDNHRLLGMLRDAGFARHYERSSDVIRVVLDITTGGETA